MFSLFHAIISKNGGVSVKRRGNLIIWYLGLIVTPIFKFIDNYFLESKGSTPLAEDPIFIIGHWRSGTTYLQSLLCQDQRFGYCSMFHTAFPKAYLSARYVLKPILKLVYKCFRVNDPIQRVRFDWDMPVEEIHGMSSGLDIHTSSWAFVFPKRARYYFDKYLFDQDNYEQQSMDRAYHNMVLKLSKANNFRRLVLKAPENTARIRRLLKYYPNAKFVFIQRSPEEVLESAKAFWLIVNKQFGLQLVDEAGGVDAMVEELFGKLHEKYLSEKLLLDETQLVEVSYEKLCLEPLRCIDKIYSTFNIDYSQEVSASITNYVNRPEVVKYKTNKYQLEKEQKERLKRKYPSIYSNHLNLLYDN